MGNRGGAWCNSFPHDNSGGGWGVGAVRGATHFPLTAGVIPLVDPAGWSSTLGPMGVCVDGGRGVTGPVDEENGGGRILEFVAEGQF